MMSGLLRVVINTSSLSGARASLPGVTGGAIPTLAGLGAAGLGDIGKHFPDTDARYAGINSRLLLSEAAQHVRQAGYEIGNIDATIIAQAPKMAPHLPQMVAHIAADCGVSPEQVNVKAKTNENLGWEGRQEGMAAQVIALIFRP